MPKIHRFLLRCLVFGLLSMGAAQSGFAQDATPTARPQPNGTASAIQQRAIQYARSPAELLAKAQNSGRLRVIVGLNTSARFQPEGDLTTAQASIQRSGVAQAKTAVLNSLASYGATVQAQSNQWTIPYLALTVDAAGLRALQNSPAVTSIQEDHQTFLSNNTDSLNNMGVPPAWANGHDGSGYTVAILDIGVEASHSFFGGRVVDEYCSSTNDNSNPDVHLVSVCPGGVDNVSGPGSANPATCASIAAAHLLSDKCDHGTHVTGIAAGNDGNNGTVNDGVARAATIIGVQVFTLYDCLNANDDVFCGNANDDRMTAFESDLVAGLEHVYSLRNTYQIAAVNMSIGGGFYNNQALCDSDYASVKSIIDQLRSVNIATVIASGNEYHGNGIAGPACISSAIAVGSTNDFALGAHGVAGKISIFTNTGFMLDLLAPGYAINSSITQPANGFGNMDGTSMATPQVTGAWAVMREALPNASVTQILQAFQTTGRPVRDDFRADGFRCGEFADEPCSNLTFKLINVNAAMSSLQPTKPILTAPLNNAMTPSAKPTLTWTSQRATQYRLYLDTQNPPVAGPIILSTASYTPPTPLQIATYYWRVEAVNALGPSELSDIHTFSVDVASNRNYTKDTTPTLTWTPITNATSYEVQIATSTSFAAPSLLHSYSVAATNLTFTIPGGDALTPGIYYWRVRAIGGTGGYSPAEILVIGS